MKVHDLLLGWSTWGHEKLKNMVKEARKIEGKWSLEDKQMFNAAEERLNSWREAPSAPARLAAYYIECRLKDRLYSETFTTIKMARAFIRELFGKRSVKWDDTNKIHDDRGLSVKCEELEDFMETTSDAVLPKNMQRQVNAFLTGKWETRKKEKRK